MLDRSPTEIAYSIFELCAPKEHARLAQTCHRFRAIATLMLYENDVKQGSYCVYYAITRCVNEGTTIATLQEARRAGCNFQSCQDCMSQDLITHAPLYLAGKGGLYNVAKFLLSSGAPFDDTLAYRVTPLFGALFAGQEKTSLLLIQYTATLQEDGMPMNALHAAVCASLLSVTEHLIQERDMGVNEMTSCGATPMMLAVTSGNIAMIRLFIKYGAVLPELLSYGHRGSSLSATLQLLHDGGIPSDWCVPG